MNVLNYFIEANLGLALVAVIYYLLLQNETQFNFSRGFLLIGIVASLMLPFLHFNFAGNIVPALSDVLPTFMLPEITVIGYQPQSALVNKSEGIPLTEILLIAYWSITCIFLCSLIFKIARLIKWIKSCIATHHENYKLIESQDNLSSFSFFNYIFIGNASQFSTEEKSQIIQHELVHARNYHSIDVLFIEAIQILFWFNPAVFLLKKYLKDIHEYQADQHAVQNTEVDAYCHLMARMALLSVNFSFANHFNQSQTLKRITMIKSVKTKLSNVKVGLISLATVCLFIAVACQDQIVEEVVDVTRNSTMAQNIPQEVQDKHNFLKARNPNAEFVIIELNEKGKKEVLDLEEKLKNQKMYVNTVGMNVLDEEKVMRSFVIFQYTDQISHLAELSSTNEVFTIVENMATPAFGMDNFFKQMAELLRYPENARHQRAEGRVFVEFIVNKDGSLSDINVAKGFNEECDAEAMRVLMLSQKWYPAKHKGKIVRQRLVLPITFKLG